MALVLGDYIDDFSEREGTREEGRLEEEEEELKLGARAAHPVNLIDHLIV